MDWTWANWATKGSAADNDDSLSSHRDSVGFVFVGVVYSKDDDSVDEDMEGDLHGTVAAVTGSDRSKHVMVLVSCNAIGVPLAMPTPPQHEIPESCVMVLQLLLHE